MPKPATSWASDCENLSSAPPLRSVVGADRRERADAADARNLDDVAGALRAHDRQHRLRHPQRTEEVRLHLRPHLVFGGLLDHAEVAVAGIVDDHVEPVEVLRGRLHGVKAGVAVGDVEPDRQHDILVPLREILECLGSRAVAATLSPRSRAASAHSRPKPFDAPVMNQVLVKMTPVFANNPVVAAIDSYPNAALSSRPAMALSREPDPA